MFADILFVIRLEAAGTSRVEQNKNDHNLSITHTVRFVTMPALLIINHIFFLLQCKVIAWIIGHTKNLRNFKLWKHTGNRLNGITGHYKFSTFIAIFLVIRKNIFILISEFTLLNAKVSLRIATEQIDGKNLSSSVNSGCELLLNLWQQNCRENLYREITGIHIDTIFNFFLGNHN